MIKLSMSEEEMLKRKYTRPYEERIAELEEKLANADYQLEGRDNEIKELKVQTFFLKDSLDQEVELHQHAEDDPAQGLRVRRGWGEAADPDQHARRQPDLRRQGKRGLELLRAPRRRPHHEPKAGLCRVVHGAVRGGDGRDMVHLYRTRHPRRVADGL